MKRSLLVTGLVAAMVLSGVAAIALTGHTSTPATPEPAVGHSQAGNALLEQVHGQSENKPSFAGNTDHSTGLARAQEVITELQSRLGTAGVSTDGLSNALTHIQANMTAHATGEGHATATGHGHP